MKVIFLDFNGVLDTWEDIDVVNTNNILRLKEIVSITGAKIVISSSIIISYYRTNTINGVLKYLINELNKYGIEVIGFLDTIIGNSREEAIHLYLKKHPEIDEFCIIDDDYDMKSFSEYLIKLPLQSEGSTGLRDEDVIKVIRILK